MKIIALPDLHQGTKYLSLIADELTQVDLVLLVGDLTNDGGEADAAEVIASVRQFNESVLAIPGNWDGLTVDAYLTREGINLHRTHKALNSIEFLGCGGSLRSIGQSPNEYTETDYQRFLDEAYSNIDPQLPRILVCHQPPYHKDYVSAWIDLSFGSRSVRKFVEDKQPLVCFTGHIHEAFLFGTGQTKIVNSGPLWKGQFAYLETNGTSIQILENRHVSLPEI
jgi:uncharacterized protein